MKNLFLTLMIVLMGISCTKETTTTEKPIYNDQFTGRFEGWTYCDFGTKVNTTVNLSKLSGNLVHIQLNSASDNLIVGHVENNLLTINQQSFSSGGGELIVSGVGIMKNNALHLELDMTKYNVKSLCHFECFKN
jgi:hypothetical protein